MSPTQPSRNLVDLESRRKHRRGDKGASEDVSKLSFENRYEEAPKEKTI